MNPTEEQFRLDLHDAIDTYADRSTPGLDPTTLIASGNRVIRRRRLTAAGGGVAALAIAAIVGTSLIGGRDTTEVRPGGPISGSTATNADSQVSSATLTLGAGPGETEFPASEFVVKIGPGAGGQADSDLGYYAKSEDGSLQLMGASSTDGLAGKSTLGFGGGDVVIGIVPSDAVAVAFAPGFDGSTGGYSQDGPTAIPGTGFSAVAFRLEKVPAATDQSFRAIWWNAEGVPATSDQTGTVLRFDTAKGPVDLWAIPGLDLYGQRNSGGGWTKALSSISEPIEDGDVTGGYRTDATKTPAIISGDLAHLYIVKGRVTDVTGSYDATIRNGQALVVEYYPTLKSTVVLAQGRLDGIPEKAGSSPILLDHLTWKDADGTQRSHDFR